MEVAITVAGAATARPDFADGLAVGPDFLKVVGVSANDILNIRSGPGIGNPVVMRAPSGVIFRNLGCKSFGTARWCKVETTDGRIQGWGSGRYLVESDPPGNAAPAKPDVPELRQRTSGEVEVLFATGCTALYSAAGRRITAGSSCSTGQLARADDAVRRCLREQGIGPGAGFGTSCHGDEDEIASGLYHNASARCRAGLSRPTRSRHGRSRALSRQAALRDREGRQDLRLRYRRGARKP
ncbi:MAG: hypothetical protein DCO97_03170 [Marivita sp. XM-24bin2]|nr:MAG: hypothetical protein DCO97_03170 [Marivita sp. XM-24bin2]